MYLKGAEYHTLLLKVRLLKLSSSNSICEKKLSEFSRKVAVKGAYELTARVSNQQGVPPSPEEMNVLVLSLLVIGVLSRTSAATCQPASTAAFSYPPVTATGYKATLVFGGLSTPRDVQFDDKGALLVVERGVGVSAYVERNDATCVGWERTLILPNTALTNGIFVEVSQPSIALLLAFNHQDCSRDLSFTFHR